MLLLSIALAAWAASPKGSYLFEISKKQPYVFVDEKAQKAPNRIYTRYNDAIENWSFCLTDDLGKFSDPPAFFAEGSVVWGASLGAAEPTSRYKLSESGDWKKTTEPLRHAFWTLHPSPQLRIYTFETVAQADLPTVKTLR